MLFANTKGNFHPVTKKGKFYSSSILITGASSGIGGALALHYAATGKNLFLSGRHQRRLEEVAASCRAKGAVVSTKIADVTNRQAMKDWITACDRERPLDLVIANAGISGGTGGPGGETEDQARLIFDINVGGVLNTLDPAIPLMVRRGRGQIALMSSLASFSGWPGAPAYSASKGAVRMYGEALRGRLARRGVSVSVICPGFISTPMTAVNDYPMPFIISAEKAARLIAAGLAKDRGRIAFPWPTYFWAGLLGLLPFSWNSLLLRRLPEKPAHNT